MTAMLHSNPPISGTVTSHPLDAPPAALEGRWEGNLGKGTLILKLRADGTAWINLQRRVRRVYHPCTWSVAHNTIRLVCTRDQAMTFPILSLSGDVMVLRMGFDSMDACQLYRTADL